MVSRFARGAVVTTDTDIVETVIGVVYYMLRFGFFSTRYTVARSDHSGRRNLITDIELPE